MYYFNKKKLSFTKKKLNQQRSLKNKDIYVGDDS